MCSCRSNSSIICLSILLLIFGMCFGGFGGYCAHIIAHHKESRSELGVLVLQTIVGILLVLLSFVGFCGSVIHSKTKFITFFVMLSILVILEIGTGIGVAVKRLEIEKVMACGTLNKHIGCLNDPHLVIGCDGAVLFVFSVVQIIYGGIMLYCFNN